MKKNKWTPKRIKELRTGKGMTQESFAKFIGVARGYINYLEAGTKKPGKFLVLLLEQIEEKNINT